jgi:surface antigen
VYLGTHLRAGRRTPVFSAHTWPWHDLPHVKGKVTAEKSNAFWSPMASAIRKRAHIHGARLPFDDLVSRPRL